MHVDFRQATELDFAYCADLYFGDREPDLAHLRSRWHAVEVRIITLHGADIGWIQTRVEDDSLFIVQFFISAPHQGQGIGTRVMLLVIEEATQLQLPVSLGVVKTNPAIRLYERLGFKTTHSDDRKHYMKRQPEL